MIFRSLAVARKRQEEKLFLEQQAAKQQPQDDGETATIAATAASTSGGNSPQTTASATAATHTGSSSSSSPRGDTTGHSIAASDAVKPVEDEGGNHSNETKDTGEGEGEENEPNDDEDEDEDEAKPKLALAGADDFLPLFIWVVLQSKIPRLVSNAEYIHAYLNPKRLMGKSGYCLINLRSAIDFVTYVEASSLKIDPEYFASQVTAVEATLPAEDEEA